MQNKEKHWQGLNGAMWAIETPWKTRNCMGRKCFKYFKVYIKSLLENLTVVTDSLL